ncbi:MAG: alanine racemase [Candidatus Excrementavichristensenella sp.]|jgi:alanine racemase
MMYRPTRMEVSCGQLRNNFRAILRYLDGRARMMAVVKADAYGHGAVMTARIALQEGADHLAVALVEEGIELRHAGIRAPILVLGGASPEGIPAALDNDLTLALYDRELLDLLQAHAAGKDTFAKVHLKIDTGMNRVGLLPGEPLQAMLKALESCPNVRLDGVFTHFCAADSDAGFTALQNQRFLEALDMVRAAGHDPIAHAAASAAMLGDSALWHDMVRPGIVQYGCQGDALLPEVKPAQRLVTRPMRLMWIEPGDTVGYGRTFTAKRPTLVATLPIGYGDGYPRLLSNKACALVHGRRVPVIGRVCMDLMMIDVSDVPGVALRDEVVLMGEQGSERITPDELAGLAGTIPYEIILGFSARVPRVYPDLEEA